MSDYFYTFLFAEFQTYVFQLEFLNLSASCQRETIYEEDIFRYFVSCNLALTEFANVEFVHFASFVQDDECAYCLSIFLRRNSSYLHVLYASI